MPYEVPNDVIMQHDNIIKLNILISACMPYTNNSKIEQFTMPQFIYWTLNTFNTLRCDVLHAGVG